MAVVGNWEAFTAGTEVTRNGKVAIIARNDALLEVSIDGNNWDAIHQFPTSQAEFYAVDLPTETYLRVTGGGQWAMSRFNQMSG